MKLKISKAKMGFCKIYCNNEYFYMFVRVKTNVLETRKYMLKVKVKNKQVFKWC